MRPTIRVVLVLVFLSIAVGAIAQPTSVTLTAALNGANERPNLGDPEGIGFAIVRLDPGANTVTYSLSSQGVTSPSVAHIHRGLPDVAGPVVVDFAPTFTNGSATGTVTTTPALISEIIANPGGFYVNIHSPEFPAGAIRGQLSGPTNSAVGFGATLNGQNERPNPGDTDGTGFALVRFDRNSHIIRYSLTSENIAPPAAAHIHRGTADVAGPVVVDFRPEFENGIASGAVTADAALIAEILGNPAGFYVNIHNADFPAGAIRGQLVPAAIGMTDLVFPIVGRVAGANGTFYRTDLALLNLSGAATPVVLEYYASGVDGMTSPTATATITLDANEETNLLGDQLQTLLGVSDGTGALRVVATRGITAVARIYNDVRANDGGTLSQFVPGLTSDWNRTTGALPLLSNTLPQLGSGYRTNVGWFNGSNAPSTITFRVHLDNGTLLESATRTVPPGAQTQVSLNQLFPALAPLDNLYVTFSTTGAPLYVYASVIDNDNGDAVLIPAQAR